MIFIKINKCHRILKCKNGVVLLYKENKHQEKENKLFLSKDICNNLKNLFEIFSESKDKEI
jgi:hypothetical protein